MSVAQHGVPGPQPGPLPGTMAPAGAAAPPAGPPGYDQRSAPPPRRSKGMMAAVALAIVLATAALVVGIIDLTRSSTSAAPAAPSSAPPAPTSTPVDIAAANKAFCTAIAPLMTESNRVAKAYSSSGAGATAPKTPEQDAATATFITSTKDWVTRMQPVIDSHPNADPYFRRSLQRFVDDRRYLITDLEAGPFQPYDESIWNDSLSAGSAPLAICWDLGVKW